MWILVACFKVWEMSMFFGFQLMKFVTGLQIMLSDVIKFCPTDPVWTPTETDALILLTSGVRMRILLSLPSKNKAPTSVELASVAEFSMTSKIRFLTLDRDAGHTSFQFLFAQLWVDFRLGHLLRFPLLLLGCPSRGNIGWPISSLNYKLRSRINYTLFLTSNSQNYSN